MKFSKCCCLILLIWQQLKFSSSQFSFSLVRKKSEMKGELRLCGSVSHHPQHVGVGIQNLKGLRSSKTKPKH